MPTLGSRFGPIIASMLRERSNDVRRATVLATIALILDITDVFLPVHYRGSGLFGSGIPTDTPFRLTLALVLSNLVVPVLIATGGLQTLHDWVVWMVVAGANQGECEFDGWGAGVPESAS